MKVLVDTSVWSLALRRRLGAPAEAVLVLQRLISEHRATLIGAIRQELLSGIRDEAQFDRLRAHLWAFPDTELSALDYELAARFFNRCRAEGIHGSNTDFLICAVAVNRSWSVLTVDRDFDRFREHIPLELRVL